MLRIWRAPLKFDGGERELESIHGGSMRGLKMCS